MAVQKKLLKGGTQQPLVYNFVDAFRQTGYLTTYLAKAGGGYIYVTDPSFKSEQIATRTECATLNTSTFSGANFITADLDWNVPVNVKGDCFLNVPVRTREDTNLYQYFVSGSIYHYNGTTEIPIASGARSMIYGIISVGGVGNFSGGYQCTAVKLNVPSQTHFKPGDILRVKYSINFSGSVAAPGDLSPAMAHDPADRTEIITGPASVNQIIFGGGYGTVSTRNSLNIPIKLDI